MNTPPPSSTPTSTPSSPPTSAGPLRCVASMATGTLLAGLCRRWNDSGRPPVALEATGGVEAARRVAAGEAFDLAVLSDDALQALAATGRVGPVSAVVVSQVAIAASAGTAPPIATVAQLQASLRAARRIAYSTGPSGKALLALLAQWQLFDELEPRLVQAPTGVPVGTLIAQGTADLGFQQLSELLHCPGIALLGPMPPGAEMPTVFSAAPCAAGGKAEQAAAFIAWLRSPEVADAVRAEGMAPAAA